MKIKGIKITLCCKIFCEAWIPAHVSMKDDQETVTEEVGVGLGWDCGKPRTRKGETRGKTVNTTRPTGSCQGSASLPALSTFLETLHAATRGLLLISAPPEDVGLSSFLR